MVPDKPQKIEKFHFTWCGHIGFRTRCYVKQHINFFNDNNILIFYSFKCFCSLHTIWLDSISTSYKITLRIWHFLTKKKQIHLYLNVRGIRKKQQEYYGSCFIGAYRLRNKRKTINHATSICKTGGRCVLRHEKHLMDYC